MVKVPGQEDVRPVGARSVGPANPDALGRGGLALLAGPDFERSTAILANELDRMEQQRRLEVQAAQEQAERTALTKAETELRFEAFDILDATARDPDNTTLAERFEQNLGDAIENRVSQLPERIQERARENFDLVRRTTTLQALTLQRERHLEAAELNLSGTLDDFLKGVIRDPASLTSARAASAAVIQSEGEAVGMPAAAIREKIEENDSALVIGALRSAAPDEAALALRQGLFNDTLSGEDLLRLTGEFERESVELAERAERAEERALKERQDAQEIGLIPDALAGTADRSVLLEELESGRISREAFVRLDAMIAAEQQGDDDTDVLLALTQDLADADPTVPDRISQAVQGGLLKPETAVTLFNRFDSARQRGGVLARAEVQSARRFVDQGVGGVRGPLAILDSAASIRTQRALREFDNLVLDAEERGEPLNAQAIADDVVERFRVSPPSPSEFPRPRFLVGTRAKPDVAETRRRTIEALDAGQITRDQARSELENLQQIEEALQ